MNLSESLKSIGNLLIYQRNTKAQAESIGSVLLCLAGKVEELERSAMLAALPETEAAATGEPGQTAECITAPNWLRHFDAMGMLIDAFRYNVADVVCCDERFPLSIAAAWPELPWDVRNIIRVTLENAFDEIDKTVGAQYGYYSGVALYRKEWENVLRLGEASE